MKLSGIIFNLLIFLAILFSNTASWAQTTRYAGTYTELTTAVTASVNNDIINITQDIVVSGAVTINKSIVINGNGYAISVPNPGLDDMGRFNGSPSGFRVFSITTSSTDVSINNLTIKGGYLSGSGGAISVSSSTTLRMDNCVVSNSRASSGGGGIHCQGLAYLNNCLLIRNASVYGGGFLLNSSGKMYVENSTIAENRSTSASGGGGGGEIGSGAILYMNNSTLSNNQSTEIGGALNVYTGTVYLLNSSVTGNVAYGSYSGGGIGNNNGNVYAVNTLFAHNYKRSAGTVGSPTAYILDDIVAYSGQANVRLFYCIHHASVPVGTQVLGNVAYSGAIDGSDNTIFSGGALSKLTDGTGVEIGTASIYRPFLYNDEGSVAPTLKTGSFTLQPGNRGTQTRFANNNNVNPVVAYENLTGPSWVDLTGTSSAGQLVDTDQVGDSRANPPAIGALEGIVDDLYILKINAASEGTVNGGTIYGDVYPSGTSVTLTAIPNSGYAFTGWTYVVGGSGTASTDNPYTFTLTQDITLVPVYAALGGGDYTITYVGNSNTGGTAPATATYSAATTIATAGTLKKSGNTFLGWNTSANGSGTAYAEGASYSAGTNLILYAQWEPYATWGGSVSTDWSTAANWVANVVPGATDPVVIPSGCANYPILASDVSVMDLVLDGDITTGSNTFTIGASTANPGTLDYISGHVIGNLRRWFAASTNSGNESGLFPIGDGTNDRFMTVEYGVAPTTGGSLTVHFRSEDGGTSGLPINGVASGGACGNFNVNRLYEAGFWRAIAADGLSGGTYDITLVGHNMDITQLCPITAIKRSTGLDPWTAVGTHVPVTGTIDNAVVKRTGASDWSDWGFGGKDDSFLPISLLHFSATPNQAERTVTLDWATEREEGLRYFEVERSANLEQWNSITQIQGQGNSAQIRSYQYIDRNPSAINYYRLKSVDVDGTTTFSAIQAVSIEQYSLSDFARIFPNPNTGSFFIEIPGQAVSQIYDMQGREIRKIEFQDKTEINGLPAGIYLVRIRSMQVSRSYRVIIQ